MLGPLVSTLEEGCRLSSRLIAMLALLRLYKVCQFNVILLMWSTYVVLVMSVSLSSSACSDHDVFARKWSFRIFDEHCCGIRHRWGSEDSLRVRLKDNNFLFLQDHVGEFNVSDVLAPDFTLPKGMLFDCSCSSVVPSLCTDMHAQCMRIAVCWCCVSLCGSYLRLFATGTWMLRARFDLIGQSYL